LAIKALPPLRQLDLINNSLKCTPSKQTKNHLQPVEVNDAWKRTGTTVQTSWLHHSPDGLLLAKALFNIKGLFEPIEL